MAVKGEERERDSASTSTDATREKSSKTRLTSRNSEHDSVSLHLLHSKVVENTARDRIDVGEGLREKEGVEIRKEIDGTKSATSDEEKQRRTLAVFPCWVRTSGTTLERARMRLMSLELPN